MKCPYCESGTNDFVPMNQTAEYSGIEMSVNRQGMDELLDGILNDEFRYNIEWDFVDGLS